MRLIDADKIKQSVTNEMLNTELNSPAYCALENVIADIDSQPIAYDVDKVLSKLEEVARDTDNYLKVRVLLSESFFYDGKVSGLDIAIAIVKSGGIE